MCTRTRVPKSIEERGIGRDHHLYVSGESGKRQLSIPIDPAFGVGILCLHSPTLLDRQ
jgi:hypothetical protein